MVLNEHGFVVHLNRKYYGKMHRFDKKTAEEQKLKLKDLYGIFLLFSIFIGLSALVLLIEIIINRLKRHF